MLFALRQRRRWREAAQGAVLGDIEYGTLRGAVFCNVRVPRLCAF